jgi:hypothetical protein
MEVSHLFDQGSIYTFNSDDKKNSYIQQNKYI